MYTSTQHLRRGFTLVEIMIVVAIFALLTAIFSHNILRARKRAHAAKVLDDLRTLDGALDQWALEHNKTTGDIAEFSDLQPYIKQQNKLNLSGHDVYDQPYGPYSVDTGPKIAEYTFNKLSDVAPADYWSPFH